MMSVLIFTYSFLPECCAVAVFEKRSSGVLTIEHEHKQYGGLHIAQHDVGWSKPGV